MKKTLFLTYFLFIYFSLLAQTGTRVDINLNTLTKGRVEVNVYPPNLTGNEVVFVVPYSVPGTYLKVNYHRFYKNMKALDKQGVALPIRIKKNSVIIKNANRLDHLAYEVKQSNGDQKIWDNTVNCAGTVFKKDQAYLINYQLITGYFKGYEDLPFEVSFQKPKALYAMSPLKPVSVSEEMDIFKARNYDHLIDNPVLFAKADTTSFYQGDTRIQISVFSESGKITSIFLAQQLKPMMDALEDFYETFPIEEYHFIFYFFDPDAQKGINLSSFNALEHLNGSIYYMHEPENLRYITFSLNWICTHEFLHTWTPLTIRSEKVADFNFEAPEMSAHTWFYEGVTDYFASLISARYDLPSNGYFQGALNSATSTTLKMKPRSMTESSTDILNHNIFDWFPKIMQLGNFYEKGKLIAFCLDVELMERSNGELRLLDVMKKLSATYSPEKPFPDDEFLDILVALTYPEMRAFFDRYVVGNEPPPYKECFAKLGITYFGKGSKRPAYGDFTPRYNPEMGHFFVKKAGKNAFNLKKGDIIQSVNGDSVTVKNYQSGQGYRLLYPFAGDTTSLTFLRKGVALTSTAISDYSYKIKKHTALTQVHKFTDEQNQFREEFYRFHKKD